MARHRFEAVSWLLLLQAVGCGGDPPSHGASAGGNSTEDRGTAPVTPGNYSYALSEGRDVLPLFTTPPTAKIRQGDRAPAETRSGLRLSAARNEFEPLQLAIGPASGSVRASMAPFGQLGGAQRIELYWAEYVEGRVETLSPVGTANRSLSGDAPTVLWATVYVPPDAPAGEHRTEMALELAGGAAIQVPVTLTVFDFALPDEIHFATQLNVDVGALAEAHGGVDAAKEMLFEHRMTPKGVTWPSGFAWGITWENTASPERCGVLYDEPDEPDQYAVGWLARRYILGEGWNGVGFPNAMLFQFVDNSTPRPESFCGIERGDHHGSSAFNREWSEWLSALDAYLVQHGLEEKAYYYVQNEPQGAEDERLAAHLCRLTKAAAPHLRIAISEEPKPAIAEDPAGSCGYDLWIAHVRAYERAYAWRRQREHGEEVWFYSLDHDPDPYFNPTASGRSGIHQRVIPWVAWTERISGWAYYDAGRFFSEGQPTVRAELLREGFEDYEYLWLANGRQRPSVASETAIDETARSIAASRTSFTRDVDGWQSLRHELGRFIEGSRDEPPVLEVESSRPRDAYYLNFQDLSGEPLAEPLVVDGHAFIKVGWDVYSPEVGYGWLGEHISDSSIALYGYDDVDGASEIERSYIYDDYGRDNLFEFDIAPGRYRITVGVGRPLRGYPGDPHNLSVEGQVVVDDEPTTDDAPTIRSTVEVDVSDGAVSVVAGGRSRSTGDYAYTFLAYLFIEPS